MDDAEKVAKRAKSSLTARQDLSTSVYVYLWMMLKKWPTGEKFSYGPTRSIYIYLYLSMDDTEKVADGRKVLQVRHDLSTSVYNYLWMMLKHWQTGEKFSYGPTRSV